MSKATLLTDAAVIKNETTNSANTATRVGEMFEDIINEAAIPTFSKYVVLATQAGIDAPTLTVLENELSGTPVASYVTTGGYRLTLADEFTIGKTFAIATTSNNGDASNNTMIIANLDDDYIDIITSQEGGFGWNQVNGILLNTPIEIRVYD